MEDLVVRFSSLHRLDVEEHSILEGASGSNNRRRAVRQVHPQLVLDLDLLLAFIHSLKVKHVDLGAVALCDGGCDQRAD